MKSLSCVRLLVTPWTAAYQAPSSMGFSRQEYWSTDLPNMNSHSGQLSIINTEFSSHLSSAFSSVQFSRSVVSNPLQPHGLQHSLSITYSQSLLKLTSNESVMPSNHLILCRPLLLLPSVFPSIRSFQMSQFFPSGGQSIEASASVLPMNIQD